MEESVAPSVNWIDTTLSRVMLAISEKVNRYGLAVHSRLYVCIMCDLSSRDSSSSRSTPAAEWLLLPISLASAD